MIDELTPIIDVLNRLALAAREQEANLHASVDGETARYFLVYLAADEHGPAVGINAAWLHDAAATLTALAASPACAPSALDERATTLEHKAWTINLTIREGETVQEAIQREAKDLERRLAEAIYGSPLPPPVHPSALDERALDAAFNAVDGVGDVFWRGPYRVGVRAAIAAYLAALPSPIRPDPSHPLEGTWPRGVHRAFVEGAKWWEWHQTGATMFPSDRDLAEERAVEKYGPVDDRPDAPSLGNSLEDPSHA